MKLNTKYTYRVYTTNESINRIMKDTIKLEKIAQSGKYARVFEVTTEHGKFETPVFMPVGTTGSIKSLSFRDIDELGARIILANTYHLFLKPGIDIVKEHGGINHFMNYNSTILTDSGGFQIMSLSKNLKIEKDGVWFRSYLNGDRFFISPELSIDYQIGIGSDIIMAFDHPSFISDTFEEAKYKKEHTKDWLMKSFDEFKKKASYQNIFGIVQGGNYEQLRKESLDDIQNMPVNGIAIGGEAIGYDKNQTIQTLDWIKDYIDPNRLHYTMGVGDIDDIFEVVSRGIDMFDCVSPTRIARKGTAIVSFENGGNKTNRFRKDITKSIYLKSFDKIDPWCDCFTCRNYSIGYICHLFRSHELLAYNLLSIHNLRMMTKLMEEIRESIKLNTFEELKAKWMNY